MRLPLTSRYGNEEIIEGLGSPAKGRTTPFIIAHQLVHYPRCGSDLSLIQKDALWNVVDMKGWFAQGGIYAQMNAIQQTVV